MGERKIRYLAIFVLLVGVTYPGRAQTQPSSAARSDTQPNAAPTAKEPEGANRCKVCHFAEVEGYARSAMAHSLRRASQEPTGSVTIPNGKITAYSTPTGSWQHLETAGAVSNFQIDYVIGSGNQPVAIWSTSPGTFSNLPSPSVRVAIHTIWLPDMRRHRIQISRVRLLRVASFVTQDLHFTFPVPTISIAILFSRMRPSVANDATVGGRHLADPKAGTIVNPEKLEPGARDRIASSAT